jgi:hypothetical protein
MKRKEKEGKKKKALLSKDLDRFGMIIVEYILFKNLSK